MRSRPTGIAVYGRGLIRALAERSPGTYTLLHPVSRLPGRAVLREYLPGVSIQAYWTGSRLGRCFSAVHALDTRLPRSYRGPLSATIFDVLSALPLSAELGLSSSEFRAKKLEAYKHIAERARTIITLSEATRQEVLARFSPRGPVIVVPPGLDLPGPVPRPEALEAMLRLGISAPFVLAVGALCPRKNVEGAVEALQAARRDRPELRLVLVGEPERGWTGSRGEQAVREAGDAVCVLGYLDGRSLWAAYAAAEALIHMSHYEGFGLTVLEALAAGTPVLASSRGGLPEAAGRAAWLVDPSVPGLAAGTLRRILDGPRDLAERRRAGLAHAASFTWARAAERIEQVLHEIAGA